MKIALTAGGGGHFAPALAILQKLQSKETVFIGRKYAIEGDSALSFEYITCKELGIPFIPLSSGRIQRSFTRHTVPSLLKIPKGQIDAFTILKSEKPDIILSFGGYLTAPIVFASWVLKIPVIIHEQTLEAGLSNRFAAQFAQKICVSWESSFKYFPPKKTILTGNPIRQEIKKPAHSSFPGSLYDKKDEKLPFIYITGGSQGSHFINNLIASNLEYLLEKYRILHQTGDAKEFKDFDNLEAVKQLLQPHLAKRYHLTKFLMPEEVGNVMRSADIVISRSGINTVTELIYLQKKAVLIPLPVSQKQEQLKNAQFMESFGLANVLDQVTVTSDELRDTIDSLLEKKSQDTNEKLIDVQKTIEHASSKLIEVLQ